MKLMIVALISGLVITLTGYNSDDGIAKGGNIEYLPENIPLLESITSENIVFLDSDSVMKEGQRVFQDLNDVVKDTDSLRYMVRQIRIRKEKSGEIKNKKYVK